MGEVIVNALERKQAEKKLKESERRLALAVDGAGLGLWDQDFSSGKTIRNERWAQMLGYELDEIEQSSLAWKELIHPDDLERKSIEEKLRSKGFLINEEVKLRKKDGTIFFASMSTTSAKDESGEVIHYDGIIEDVTEEHKAREDILAYQSNLKSLTNDLIIAEERAKRRLAMTLHDKLGQSLVLAKFKEQ